MKPGRMPAGMGGFNMQNLMKQAQKMQQDMARVQEELEKREYTATAGGGAVSVTVTGKSVSSIAIDPSAVDPGDVEMLQDMLMAAVNDALRQSDEASAAEMQKVTGGAGMPGMF